jgi:hypothetical protein
MRWLLIGARATDPQALQRGPKAPFRFKSLSDLIEVTVFFQILKKPVLDEIVRVSLSGFGLRFGYKLQHVCYGRSRRKGF